MKQLLFGSPPRPLLSTTASSALLAMRLLIGVAFIQHGYDKIIQPFSWMGEASNVPGALQAFAAIAEFGGGFTLILGLLTPLTTLSMAFTMIGAILFHLEKGDSFVGGYELASLYLASTMVLLVTGPGRFAIDKYFQENSKTRL